VDYGEKIKKDYSIYEALDIPERYRMPRDITKCTPEQVRSLQSFWTGWLSYLYVALAHAKIRVGAYETLMDDFRRRSFVEVSAKQRSRQTKDYISSLIVKQKGYKKLQIAMMKAKATETLYQSFITVAELIVRTSSREQTWREKELERYYGRQGQGT